MSGGPGAGTGVGPSAVVPAQYEALRRGAGVVDLGRDALAVHGPDALDYLQGQLSQDLTPLGVGASTWSLLLSPQGKLDALVRVTRADVERVVIDVDGGFGEATRQRLERFRLRVKATVEPLAWRCLAVRGPHAASLVVPVDGAAATAGAPVLALPFDWNGVVGVDLLGPAPAAPAGAVACDRAAWEAVRVEAGIPVMGAELDERTIAAEAGLVERTVSFTKGCFTGQELVARLDARGNRVARHLRGLVGEEGADPGAFVPGAGLSQEDKAVGAVTSVAWSPGLGRVVALAYLHRSVAPPAAVTVGGRARAEVRDLPLL
ncbi:MAG TPA: glycine cleavage T C-terminal barrel domain-containing protein [Acidimicrobiales bacterium]|nr:glycine cleavage T C-terminal barrel domain-containing protein [Acidimicrobiales bacterium]